MSIGKSEEMTEDLRTVSHSANQFSTPFYKILSKHIKDNIICSPLSVDVVLAMLSYGASGTTRKQLHDALAMTSDDNVIKSGYGNLIDTLNNVKDVDLSIANKLFSSDKIKMNPNYLKLTSTDFRSALQQLNFSDSKAAAKIINTWVEEQTKNRIKDLFQTNAFNGNTGLVLVNAIYFKGLWEDQFDPKQTADMNFYINKEDFIKVPTMQKKRNYNNGYNNELNATFIELPYKGKDFSLVVILPMTFDGLEHVIENLDKVNMTELLKTGRKTEVVLYLPKFKIETEINLQPILEEMGMKEIFQSDANFTELSETPMKVDKAIQKAFIEVSEEGTEAAAATAIVGVSRCMIPQMFKVDRPFVCTILHHSTKTNLFIGTILNPTI